MTLSTQTIKYSLLGKISLIFCIALVARIMILPLVWTNPNVGMSKDGKGYDNLANNILNGNGYSRNEQPPFEPDMMRTPTYPFFLSMVYRVAGAKNYIAVYCFQIILGALACVLTYLIGKLLFAERVALIAAILLSFDLLAISFAYQIMTETLFLLLWLLSCYFLFRFFVVCKESNFDAAYAGLFLGLATLCRPVSYYFPVFVLGLIIIWKIRSVKSTQSCVKGFCFFVAAFLLAVGPWIWRNYQTFQETSLSDIGGEVLLLNHAASVEVFLTGDSHNEVKKRYREKLIHVDYASKNEKIKACHDFALEVIKSHPFVYIKSQLYGCFKMLFINHQAHFFGRVLDRPWNPPGILAKQGGILTKLHNLYDSNHWVTIFVFFSESIFTVLIGCSIFIALFLLYKERSINTLLLLLALFCYFVPISSGGVGTSNRVILPLRPFILMATSYCIFLLWRRIFTQGNKQSTTRNAV